MCSLRLVSADSKASLLLSCSLFLLRQHTNKLKVPRWTKMVTVNREAHRKWKMEKSNAKIKPNSLFTSIEGFFLPAKLSFPKCKAGLSKKWKQNPSYKGCSKCDAFARAFFPNCAWVHQRQRGFAFVALQALHNLPLSTCTTRKLCEAFAFALQTFCFVKNPSFSWGMVDIVGWYKYRTCRNAK